MVPATNVVTIVSLEGPGGSVQVLPRGAREWEEARPDRVLQPGDRIRSGEFGRVTLRWSDRSTLRLAPFSLLEVDPPSDDRGVHGFQMLRGWLRFFHRDKPTDSRFRTPTASAAVRGTEFSVSHDEATQRTVLAVIDGEVAFDSAEGHADLRRGEEGVAVPGLAPGKRPQIDTLNLIQWCLYYPAVLDPDELGLDAATEAALAGSLAAYRAGDLPGALSRYPGDRQPATVSERAYVAALRLVVGDVGAAGSLLRESSVVEGGADAAGRLESALRTLIRAVELQPARSLPDPKREPGAVTASEWLAASYAYQAVWDLDRALAAAKAATVRSPGFAFAWARVAELEFGFGRIPAARTALSHALAMAPRHAPSAALSGFLLCARGRFAEAERAFDQAIGLDPAYGTAWLGRGLTRVRQGRTEPGRDDVQVAVTLEPRRAVFRSYLAKTYQVVRQPGLARRELRLARELDPGDPTAWLYGTLLAQEENEVNTAVRDLEQSVALNDHRQVYRSRLLLDQDRAVRGANLAAVYRDAGLTDWAVREAGRAVSADYANYSSHLFLADSYYHLLDPRQHDQRYETARVSEFLIASLLAPVGAGVLSAPVSAQEYGRLFERDGLGFFSQTDYLSRGAWQEYAVQHGQFDRMSYALGGYYRTDPGQRPNNDLEQRQLSIQFKQQLSPADLVYVQAVVGDADYGDLAQVDDPEHDGDRVVRHDESQAPLLWLGYHHEWNHGSRTLVLAGYLEDTLQVADPTQETLVVAHNGAGATTAVLPYATDLQYRSEQAWGTLEVQQVLEHRGFTFIGGGRFQAGAFDTASEQRIIEYTNAAGSVLRPAWFDQPPRTYTVDSRRASGYGYVQARPGEAFELVAGVSYDWLEYPANFRYPPLSGASDSTGLWSPKAGLVWTPASRTTVRAAYSQSLGGVSFDQSVQLEPTQVAGFNQAWRSLMPESVAGTSAAARFENANLSIEQAFAVHTYVTVGGEFLQSRMDRMIGVFDRLPPQSGVFPLPPFIRGGETPESLDYQERSLMLTVHQLLAENWTVGGRYRVSRAELSRAYPRIPAGATGYGGFQAETENQATLQRGDLFVQFHHRSGFFAGVDAGWWGQASGGTPPVPAGDDFWQLNVSVGYRFARRQAEVRLGGLNLLDQDYHLNPLNLMAELPRERTLAISCRFSF